MVVTSPPYYGLRDYGLEPTIWGGARDCCQHEWSASSSYTGHRGNRGQTPQAKWTSNQDYPQHLVKHHRHGDDGTLGSTLEGGLKTQMQQRFEPSSSSFCQCCNAWLGCLGLEPSPDLFVAHLVEVFREIWRVLRDDGLCFCNIGDSYAGSWGNQGRKEERGTQRPINGPMMQKLTVGYPVKQSCTGKIPEGSGLRPKSLCLVPQRLALALADDGWIIRNWLCWVKPNVLPSSVKDRFTVDYEPILMLAKTERAFFDMEPVREAASGQGAKGSKFNKGKTASHQLGRSSEKEREECPATRQPRATWVIPTESSPLDHYAAFPRALVERAILCSTSAYGACASCGAPYRRVVEKGAPLTEWQQACGADASGGYSGTAQKEYATARAQDPSATKTRILAGMVERRTKGWWFTCTCHQPTDFVSAALLAIWPPETVPCVCLDPFSGTGTVGVVAQKLGRRAILIDQSPKYTDTARERCGKEG